MRRVLLWVLATLSGWLVGFTLCFLLWLAVSSCAGVPHHRPLAPASGPGYYYRRHEADIIRYQAHFHYPPPYRGKH